ncbi:hypothetical protein [Pseudomonas alkylphenolica]|nr:hypothetical protein [Pseudomonas alkylphenolica]
MTMALIGKPFVPGMVRDGTSSVPLESIEGNIMATSFNRAQRKENAYVPA